MDLVEALEYFDSKVDYELAKTCVDKEKVGSSCSQCLSNRYYSNLPVSYRCDQLRLIYVLRYLPVHFKENLDVLEALNRKGVQNSWGSPVEVLALGGGPGSEIAALQHFVATHGFFGSAAPEIHVTRLDRVAEWKPVSDTVRKISQGNLTKFKYLRIDGDVCDVNNFKGAYDMVFLSYIVSELTDAKANELGESLAKVVKKKCVLVFNDRNEVQVVRRIEMLAGRFSHISNYVSTAVSHVGIPYPDAIKDRVGPKLSLSSYRRGIFVEP
ncbi:MAG: hypothetical protein C3F18_12370 [Nitrosomonadales bacterium]|nr:MAG: hypothetical protein C3F18_12370 [Nitrosomonadales bacterium]